MPLSYSTEEKSKAIFLRKQGQSLRKIAKKLKISLSTAQLWTKNVILSEEQKRNIILEHNKKLTIGRNRFIKQRKVEKTKTESDTFSKAKSEIQIRQADSFFFLGLALYWAEGFKKDHSLGFVNSDPAMIKTFLKWLRKYGEIDSKNIRLRVQIHEIYKSNIGSIELFWSEFLQIPSSQFQTPFYQVSKSKPTLLDPTYKGLLRIRVIGTRNLFIKILGWLDGLREKVY